MNETGSADSRPRRILFTRPWIWANKEANLYKKPKVTVIVRGVFGNIDSAGGGYAEGWIWQKSTWKTARAARGIAHLKGAAQGQTGNKWTWRTLAVPSFNSNLDFNWTPVLTGWQIRCEADASGWQEEGGRGLNIWGKRREPIGRERQKRESAYHSATVSSAFALVKNSSRAH